MLIEAKKRLRSASPAIRQELKGLGGNWTFADLDAFLTKPKAFAKGTKMTFGGVKKPEDRAALLALLRSLSASPQPLP